LNGFKLTIHLHCVVNKLITTYTKTESASYTLSTETLSHLPMAKCIVN